MHEGEGEEGDEDETKAEERQSLDRGKAIALIISAADLVVSVSGANVAKKVWTIRAGICGGILFFIIFMYLLWELGALRKVKAWLEEDSLFRRLDCAQRHC